MLLFFKSCTTVYFKLLAKRILILVLITLLGYMSFCSKIKRKSVVEYQEMTKFYCFKFCVFMATLRNSKNFMRPFHFQTYQKYHQHNVYRWEPLLCQILATISFRDSPWTDWQAQDLKEIPLIPHQLDHKSYHWKCNGYLM